MAGAGDVAEDRSSTVINFTRNQFSSFFFLQICQWFYMQSSVFCDRIKCDVVFKTAKLFLMVLINTSITLKF